ncbi:uncharacterized protein LOC134768400 [Penaeus indicus]|uniref:uncharacterized protein LOC134768400 n=1 Tax=Penaeus indicus TaxID=29960 RepID=UPI00300DACDA
MPITSPHKKTFVSQTSPTKSTLETLVGIQNYLIMAQGNIPTPHLSPTVSAPISSTLKQTQSADRHRRQPRTVLTNTLPRVSLSSLQGSRSLSLPGPGSSSNLDRLQGSPTSQSIASQPSASTIGQQTFNHKSASSQPPVSTTNQHCQSAFSQPPVSTASQHSVSRQSALPISTASQHPVNRQSALPISTASQHSVNRQSALPISTASQRSVNRQSALPVNIQSTASQHCQSASSQPPVSTTNQHCQSAFSQPPVSTANQHCQSAFSQPPVSTTSQHPVNRQSALPVSIQSTASQHQPAGIAPERSPAQRQEATRTK